MDSASSPSSDSSAEQYALRMMWKDICGTFAIDIEHPSLITHGVINHVEKDDIFQKNPTRRDRISALLEIISREAKAKNYQRFKSFLDVLRMSSTSHFLWQGLQRHLQEYQQLVQATLRKLCRMGIVVHT